MGQVFFEVTMPKIAEHLERLATTLQMIGDVLQASHAQRADVAGDPKPAAAEPTTMSISP
jgi:hypothetical protein